MVKRMAKATTTPAERDPIEMDRHVPVVVVQSFPEADPELSLVHVLQPVGQSVVGDLLVLMVDRADDHGRGAGERLRELDGVAVGAFGVPVLSEFDGRARPYPHTLAIYSKTCLPNCAPDELGEGLPEKNCLAGF